MRRYSILHPLWMAFYSGDIYDDVARNWRIQPFLYLIILLAIGWLPRSSQLQNAVDDWMTQEAPLIIDQIPAITISDGQLSRRCAREVPHDVFSPCVLRRWNR